MSPEAHAASLPQQPLPERAYDQDQLLIDRIIYLGSLASERSAIDPLMETLREVTAHWQPNGPLMGQDRQALTRLEGKLKQYLVGEDPLREFTADSLEARLRQQAETRNQTVTKKSLFIVLILSVLSAGLSFALPWPMPLSDRFLLSIPLFFLTLHIGISWFYLTALKQFNHELRRAFIYLCAGMIILSLGFSHYVVIQLLNIGDYPAFRYGGFTWLIALPFMCMFTGLSIYARLLHVKSRLMSLPTLLGIITLVSVLVIIAPHSSADDEALFDFWAVGAAMITTFALLSSALANKISEVVTPAYAKSSTWLYYYTLVVGLGSISALGFLFILGELHGVALNLVIAICGVPPQLILLYTGYLFKKETIK